MVAAAMIAPLAMAQTDPATSTTTTTTTTEPVPADAGWWDNHLVFCPSMPDKFRRNEWSVDLFATYTALENGANDVFETSLDHGVWGGGVGANYFITHMFGIGTDINMPHDGGNLVNNVNGSLIARLPIESVGLAPYLFGGGGRTTDRVWEWTGHAGIGLEFRANPTMGIFIDTRYVWADHLPDTALFRGGFRFVF